MSDRKLQVIPLGGLGEFGMNSMAIRYGDDIIVIDAGMMFPDAELLGVDIVTPDFSYLEENRDKVRALLLTHGHEDHIGGIPFLLSQINLPIYGTAFTLALVERRLEEHELLSQASLNVVKAGEKIEIGPFAVEFIRVTHSIVSAVALAVTTPLGVIIHTGDFKVDPTPTDNELFDLHTLADYGRRGVLLLMSDSTNVDRPGYTESERAVRPRCASSQDAAKAQVLDHEAAVVRSHKLGRQPVQVRLQLRPRPIALRARGHLARFAPPLLQQPHPRSTHLVLGGHVGRLHARVAIPECPHA